MGIRVLHVIDSLVPQAGSAAVPLCAQMESLAASGVECSRATSSCDATALHDMLRSCDVVHVHGWGFDTARRAARAARRSGIPYVISPYGALTESQHHRPGLGDRLRNVFGESGLVRSASLIAAINKAEASALRDRGFGNRVEVLTPGLDFDGYNGLECDAKPSRVDANEQVLLVLGPVGPLGGGVPLLKAFAELGTDADGWRVVFAGADVGDWRRQMEAAVRRKGGGGRVTFTHADDLDTQRSWLARADALASVALHPMCPTSVLQALACGIAILATMAIAPDDFDDGIIVCEPTRERIARGLRALLSMTPNDRRSMGLRARDAARSRFDASDVASRWADRYGRLSGRRAPMGLAAHVGA